jgi:hypothetical protein
MPSSHDVPAVSGAHVPSVPPVFAAVHPWHVAVQAVLQQTSSTQCMLLHWESAVHGPPLPPAQVPKTGCLPGFAPTH